jgi:hypothetical protein
MHSRLNLLTIAAIGLVLMHARSLFNVAGMAGRVCHFIGNVLFIFTFWIIFTSFMKADPDDLQADWANPKAAASSIVGLGLLALSRFAPVEMRSRDVFNIAGWLLVFYCCSVAKSRWQEITWIGVYAIALSYVHWRQFLIFREVEIHLLVVLLVLWVAISGSIFLFLVRRKAANSQLPLH